jgi:hypothetical protein
MTQKAGARPGAVLPALLVLLAAVGPARGEIVGEDEQVPTLRALRIEEAIRLDGVLDEKDWGRASAATGFTQREPRPGEPATERTFVRVLYDDTTLYIGIDARDADPSQIIAREMGRDTALRRDDSVVILLDTFHDRRNAYFFETNPNSSRTDALIADEGRDANFEWDGVWEVRSRRTGRGWSAEMAIPFASIRFDPALSTWGLNIRRGIRHKNEQVYWSPIPLEADTFRISLAGNLSGLRPPEPSLNLWVKPFGTASAGTSFVDTGRADPDDTDAGLDVKWGVGRNLSLDLTYNTDFAETEVDDLRVNLTRFSLFFPEKREFFLENAGIFEFGKDGSTPFGGAPLIKPFFSRRIGLPPEEPEEPEDVQEIPIEWGARLTGRAGDWNFGILDVQTEAVSAIDPSKDVPKNNWGAVRLKRNVGERSSVGMILTNRQASGDDFNRVYGVDSSFRPRQELAFDVFGLASETSGLSGDEWAAGAAAAWRGPIWDWRFDYFDIRENFNPEMGFLLRENGRSYFSRVGYEPRLAHPKIRSVGFSVEAKIFDLHDGPVESARADVELFGITMENELHASLWWAHEEEELFEDFEIFDIPDDGSIIIKEGTYRFNSYSLFVSTNQGAPISSRLFLVAGEFYDGDRFESDLTVQLRPGRHFRTSTSWGLSDVKLPEGNFETNIYRQRFDVSFTANMGASLIAQYSDADELVAVNARFQWRYRPGSDLFIVFNENWDAPSLSERTTQDRRITVKLTHLFQF